MTAKKAKYYVFRYALEGLSAAEAEERFQEALASANPVEAEGRTWAIGNIRSVRVGNEEAFVGLLGAKEVLEEYTFDETTHAFGTELGTPRWEEPAHFVVLPAYHLLAAQQTRRIRAARFADGLTVARTAGLAHEPP